MKMINLFAASGHRNYAKRSRLYLEEMLSLSYTNQWLNKQFEDGFICMTFKQILGKTLVQPDYRANSDAVNKIYWWSYTGKRF